MKKLLYIVLIAYLLYFSIGTIVDYSIEFQDVTKDKVPVNLEKPLGTDNEGFIETIESVSRESGADILYKTTRFTGDTTSRACYMTLNNKNFIPIISAEKFSILSTGGQLKYGTLFGDVYFHRFGDIKDFNLDNINLYISPDQADTFIRLMAEKNIVISKVNEISVNNRLNTVINQVYPMCIILFTMIFYVLHKKKEIVIKRLNGYSSLNILAGENLRFSKNLGILALIICLLSGLAHNLLFPNVLKDFLVFQLAGVSLIAVLIIVVFIIVNFLTLIPSSQLDIKGRSQNKQLFVVAFIFKSIVGFVLVLYFSTSLSNLITIYHTNKTLNFITGKVDHYVNVPFNMTPDQLGHIDTIYDNALEFYKKTVDRFNGILIETKNYENLSQRNIGSENFGQNWITINDNYLDFNPIYNAAGQQIGKEMLNAKQDALNVLIPQSLEYTKDTIIKRYLSWYQEDGLKDEFINTIVYDDSQSRIYAYNSFVVDNTNGIINSPVIEVFNEKYKGNQAGNFFGRSYMLYVDSQYPHDELLPYLIECHLEQTIIGTPSVKEGFAEVARSFMNQLIMDAINVIVNLTGLLALSIYAASLYYTNNRKKVSVMRMNGFRFREIYKRYLWLQILTFCGLFIVALYMQSKIKNTVPVFLIIAVIDIALFAGVTKTCEKNQIAEVMKEG